HSTVPFNPSITSDNDNCCSFQWQIIANNTPACSRADMNLSCDPKYSHIFWTPCIDHSLNLALKSICNASKEDSNAYSLRSWIEEFEHDVKSIRNSIVNHYHALSIFNKHSDLRLLKRRSGVSQEASLQPKSKPNIFKRKYSDRMKQRDKFKKPRSSSSKKYEECLKCHHEHPGKPCYRDIGVGSGRDPDPDPQLTTEEPDEFSFVVVSLSPFRYLSCR
ncbi:hypothetical protein EJ110_NYTH44099, partial [Nymphaea thermarum]